MYLEMNIYFTRPKKVHLCTLSIRSCVWLRQRAISKRFENARSSEPEQFCRTELFVQSFTLQRQLYSSTKQGTANLLRSLPHVRPSVFLLSDYYFHNISSIFVIYIDIYTDLPKIPANYVSNNIARHSPVFTRSTLIVSNNCTHLL